MQVKDIASQYEFPGESLTAILVDDSIRQQVEFMMFGLPGAGAAALVRSLAVRKKVLFALYCAITCIPRIYPPF